MEIKDIIRNRRLELGLTMKEPNNAPKQKKPVLTGFLIFPVNTGFFNIKTFYEHTMIL